MAYFMTNIHDRQGYTKKEILYPNELKKIVEEWLETNSFSEALKKEGIWRYDQTYGRTAYVKIDTRDGEIRTGTTTPNQYSDSDSFFVTLASTDLYEENWQDILGDDHKVTCTKEQAENSIFFDDSNIEYLEDCNNDNGTYTIEFKDFGCSAEEWVDFWSDNIDGFDDWDSRIADCEDDYLENVGNDWEDAVDGYYENIKEESED